MHIGRRQIRQTWVVVLLLSFAFFGQAEAQKEGRRVNISIGQFPSDTEMTAWTAYGLGLADWVNKNRIADSAPEGPFIPTFEAELHARQSQIQIWRELNQKGKYSLPYMDVMLKVDAAGFLREYIWHFHRRPGWGSPPAELRMDVFSQWHAEHLRGHAPQTGARIVFGPPAKE